MLSAPLGATGIGGRWQLPAKLVERGESGRELHLELAGVNALGGGHEDAPLQEFELEAQPLVRGAQVIALLREFGHSGPLRGELYLEGGERSLERSDSSVDTQLHCNHL